jgi:hypothetical protein
LFLINCYGTQKRRNKKVKTPRKEECTPREAGCTKTGGEGATRDEIKHTAKKGMREGDAH